jgi:hypothetical protein
MPERPEYIKCIQHTHAEKQKTSWCGKQLSSFDWVFQDIDHATYNVMSGGRQVPCPECINAIIGILKDD